MTQRKRSVERRPIDGRLTRLFVETLEQGLSRHRGRPVRIRDVHREFASSSSSFPTERLRVTLDDTRKPLRIFFKDLNPQNQLTKARAVRDHDRTPSRRELDMYEAILSPERFGTLRLYGYRWEPDTGRYWVFLEDGGRTVLHNFLDMPRWSAAARWAGRFHAATRDLPAAQTSFLPRYDRAHYARCAERVEQVLPNLDAPERDLVGRGLDSYTARIDRLSALPVCVIHGQLFGKNILLRGGGGRPAHKIAVIDWETAALGPGTFDLVSLTSGKWTPEQREAMWSGYFEQYLLATGQPLEWETFRRELADVALYQSLEWIAWWGRHRGLSRHFANFIRELGAVLEEEATEVV